MRRRGPDGGVADEARVTGRRAPWLVAAAFAILAAALFPDYGITWDEGVQSLYGELTLSYYVTGGQDRRADTFRDLRYYGPLFEATAALAYRAVPRAKWEVRHLLTALTAAAALLAAGLVARRLDGAAALAGAVGLLTLPRFFGHAFDNSKDTPFAAAFALALLACTGLLAARRLRPPLLGLCGLAVGAALGIRSGGVLLLAFVAFALAWRVAFRRLRPLHALLALAGVSTLAWSIMVACWPWAQQAPLRHPLEAMAMVARFASSYPVLFAGQVLDSAELPRSYVPWFFGITTPLPHLLLAGVGLLAPLARGGARRGIDVLVRVWLVLPVALAVVLRPNVYDGIRHFAFVMPALAILAARAGVLLGRRLVRDRRLLPWVATLPLLLSVPALVRLHPYQFTYFNELVGGLAGAAGRYETDYWCASYKEAVEWINGQGPAAVLVAANAYSGVCAAPYLAAGSTMDLSFGGSVPGPLPEPFDYYVATTRYGLDASYPEAPIVHTVGRDGAVFTVVRARRRPPG